MVQGMASRIVTGLAPQACHVGLQVFVVGALLSLHRIGWNPSAWPGRVIFQWSNYFVARSSGNLLHDEGSRCRNPVSYCQRKLQVHG